VEVGNLEVLVSVDGYTPRIQCRSRIPGLIELVRWLGDEIAQDEQWDSRRRGGSCRNYVC